MFGFVLKKNTLNWTPLNTTQTFKRKAFKRFKSSKTCIHSSQTFACIIFMHQILCEFSDLWVWQIPSMNFPQLAQVGLQLHVFWCQTTVTEASSELSGGKRTCVHGTSCVTPNTPIPKYQNRGEELNQEATFQKDHVALPSQRPGKSKCLATPTLPQCKQHKKQTFWTWPVGHETNDT